MDPLASSGTFLPKALWKYNIKWGVYSIYLAFTQRLCKLIKNCSNDFEGENEIGYNDVLFVHMDVKPNFYQLVYGHGALLTNVVQYALAYYVKFINV